MRLFLAILIFIVLPIILFYCAGGDITFKTTYSNSATITTDDYTCIRINQTFVCLEKTIRFFDSPVIQWLLILCMPIILVVGIIGLISELIQRSKK
jgi:hypothetical protein